MARVTLEGVVKEFGVGRAVDGVSLEIGDGEFFTLLGPSGCGKTTTLRLIAGLEFPDRGQVLIGGEDVSRTPPARRRIAMVFQNYALYPHMTIRENIGYPLKLRKVPPDELKRRVEEVAARLDLARALDRPPSQVSGGQQQRAAVARAMVQAPRAYLFDEPLSNLDARLRLESRRFLKQTLREAGGTAVYVTHDQTEAMALSDRVGVMKDGRLVQVAPPIELYRRPANVFVAGFIGHLPMNLIEGRAVAEGGLAFSAGSFRSPLPAAEGIEAGAGLTLGVRPEDVVLTAEGGFPAEVVDLERLGAESILTARIGENCWIVRIPALAALKTGERVHLDFPAEAVHLFDGQGQRLPARAERSG